MNKTTANGTVSDTAKVRAHHHLITAQIVYRHKDDEKGENIGAIQINGVLIDADRNIPARLLGKAQQIVQLQFHNRMQDENLVVVDVILLNLAYLGHMTQEEFQAVPEGTKLAPRNRSYGTPERQPMPETDAAGNPFIGLTKDTVIAAQPTESEDAAASEIELVPEEPKIK